MNTADMTTAEAPDVLVLDMDACEVPEPPRAAEDESPLQLPSEARRGTQRVRPAMACSWGATETCPRNGQITSLGPTSCFVKTKAELTPGQTLYVKGWLPSERWLTLRGTVSYHLPKVGFGLAFDPLCETDARMLRVLLDFYGD